MKVLKQILIFSFTLLFLSCDVLDEVVSSVEESEAELDDSYYLQEGWNAMNSQQYGEAINFFQYLIDISQDQLDLQIQSTHGLAWAKLFYSTTPMSGNKKNDRDESYELFFDVENFIEQIDEDSVEDLSQIQCDIYAGKILYSDYMIYYYQNLLSAGGDVEQQRDYYSQGELSGNDENGNGLIEQGLYALISDIEQNCQDYNAQNYIFDHNITIDINDLKLILAKDYIRRAEYVAAKDIINSIIDNMGSTTVEFRLSQSSSLLEGTKSVIGDFQYKTIDDNDAYQLEDMGDYYYIEIGLNPSMPCNFGESFDENTLRDELFECVNGFDYFNSNSSKTFKYRFIDGEYNETIISNQESDLPSSCSSSDGYRTLEIPYGSSSTIILDSACFNSCSSVCD